jgi:hypothetical protein
MNRLKKVLLFCFLLVSIAPALAALEGATVIDNSHRDLKPAKKHSLKKKKRRSKKKSTLSKGDSGPQEEVSDQREVSQQADKSGKDTKRKKY